MICNKQKKIYDLNERTSKFGQDIISLVKTFKYDLICQPLLNQLVRAATSVGANYMEADCAESKKDFIHKMSISRKEAKETAYWLNMVAVADNSKINDCRRLWREAHELVLIFSAILIAKKKY